MRSMSTIALDARVKVSGSFPWPIDFKTFIIAIMIVLFYGLIEEGLSLITRPRRARTRGLCVSDPDLVEKVVYR